MKQICQEYYCNYLNRNIGDGMCCFTCPHHKMDSGTTTKNCKYEKVIREYTREV